MRWRRKHHKDVLEMPVTTGKRISNPSQQSKGERKSSEGSSIAVLGSVIGFFVLCWSFDTVISFCTKLEICIISDSLFRVSDLMIFVNSAINPLVYSLLKKDIKRELRSLWCCLYRDQVTEIWNNGKKNMLLKYYCSNLNYMYAVGLVKE